MCFLCKWKAAQTPAVVTTPAVKRALIVGINKYKLPNADLRGCVNDSENIYNLLTSRYSFLPENIRVLTDERATRTNILDRVSWLVNSSQAGDTAIYYHSGHGTQLRLRDANGALEDHNTEAFVPYDFETWDDLTPLITDDCLSNAFKDFPVSKANLACVFDTCFSGGIFNRILAPETNPHYKAIKSIKVPFDLAARFRAPTTGIPSKLGELRSLKGSRDIPSDAVTHILLSGCLENETSAENEINGTPQGFMTFSLIDTISKYLNRFNSWEKAYSDMVLEVNRLGGTQHPNLCGSKRLRDLPIFGGE